MSNHQKVLALGTKRISKLLVEYAAPAIIAMTATSLYYITNSIFIGHGVGQMALSGLAITLPFMNLLSAFGILVGVGAGVLLSIKMGEKDYNYSNIILGNFILAVAACGFTFIYSDNIFNCAGIKDIERCLSTSCCILVK